jgi:hypothetical protein
MLRSRLFGLLLVASIALLLCCTLAHPVVAAVDGSDAAAAASPVADVDADVAQVDPATNGDVDVDALQQHLAQERQEQDDQLAELQRTLGLDPRLAGGPAALLGGLGGPLGGPLGANHPLNNLPPDHPLNNLPHGHPLAAARRLHAQALAAQQRKREQQQAAAGQHTPGREEL